MLEEVLELTRLNASRPQRGRINANAIIELIGAIEELLIFQKDNEIASYALQRLRMPIKELCLEAGMPEAYERLLYLREKILPKNETVEGDKLARSVDIQAVGTRLREKHLKSASRGL